MAPIPGVAPDTQVRADSDPPLARIATRADLEHLPENIDAEIIGGRLYVLPKRRARHTRIARVLGNDVGVRYDDDVQSPGGWWILVEPGIELPDAAEIGPDVAGWRRERMPELPEDAINVVPDWVCEILSPSTRRHDLSVKRPFYASVGVQWMWIVEPEAQLLTISALRDGRWSELKTFAAEGHIRAEPFEDVEIDLARWWRTK